MSVENTAHFRPLSLSVLQPNTGFQHPYYFQVNPVKVHSAALAVMTDLKFMPAATCFASIDIVAARQIMIARGVRLLLVVDDREVVAGLITARDLEGEKVDEIMRRTSLSMGEILVSEVMTGADHIEVLELDDVLHAHVGDVIETLKGSGRQHAVVVDRSPMDDHQKIRGIFSSSQIARQLGISNSVFDLAGTFEELDRILKKAGG